MYMLEVFRRQLIVLAEASGLLLAAITYLVYVTYAKPRPDQYPTEERPSSFQELLRSVPWVLYLTYGAAVALLIAGLWLSHSHPPNW